MRINKTIIWKKFRNSTIFPLYKKSLGKLVWNYKINKKIKKLHDIGYDILEELGDLTSKNNIMGFCTYGTLLGAVRDKALIPHDYDIDYGIVDQNGFTFEKLEKILIKNGYRKKREFIFQNKIVEQTYIKDNLDIDFFLYIPSKNSTVTYGFIKDNDKDYPSAHHFNVSYFCLNNIENTIKIKLKNNKEVIIPENYEEIIVKNYGENWRIPDPNFKSTTPRLEENVFGIEKTYLDD